MRRTAILLIEDDGEIADLEQAVLRRVGGYEVERVPSVAAALASFERRRPALVLLDIAMPIADGWHFIRSPVVHDSGVPIVVVSALAQTSVPVPVRRRLSGYILKPFGVSQLLSACVQALSPPGPARGGIRLGQRRTFIVGATIRSAGATLHGQLLELGDGGFRIHSDLPLRLHEPVEVQARMPWRRSGLELHGRVRWRNLHLHGLESTSRLVPDAVVFGEGEGTA